MGSLSSSSWSLVLLLLPFWSLPVPSAISRCTRSSSGLPTTITSTNIYHLVLIPPVHRDTPPGLPRPFYPAIPFEQPCPALQPEEAHPQKVRDIRPACPPSRVPAHPPPPPTLHLPLHPIVESPWQAKSPTFPAQNLPTSRPAARAGTCRLHPPRPPGALPLSPPSPFVLPPITPSMRSPPSNRFLPFQPRHHLFLCLIKHTTHLAAKRLGHDSITCSPPLSETASPRRRRPRPKPVSCRVCASRARTPVPNLPELIRLKGPASSRKLSP
jgi:hypothetical protein